MDDPKSLTADLKDAIAKHAIAHPDTYRLTRLEKKLPEIELAVRGSTWHTNLAVAEARDATSNVAIMKKIIAELLAENENLKSTVGDLMAKVEAESERLNEFLKWAKTKGKT